MLRRTKIVATLGPSTDTPESLAAIIGAGVDATRLNFSHGSAQEHIERANSVREMAVQQGRFVALLADLQGPKLRISRFSDHKVTLVTGQQFVLDAAMDKEAGTGERVGIDYEQLIDDVAPGDVLVLDDGRIEMEVESVGEQFDSVDQSGTRLIQKRVVDDVDRRTEVPPTVSEPTGWDLIAGTADVEHGVVGVGRRDCFAVDFL